LKKDLIGRFRYVWTFELFNALIVFPGLAWRLSANLDLGVFTILTTGLLSFLLIVGSAFAFLKWRDVRSGTHTLARCGGLFRALRAVIPVVLAVPPVLLGYWGDTLSSADVIVGLLLYTLAALEYVNYFHVQLSYDNRKDVSYLLSQKTLKRGLIAREFGW
jgi:uncharacterized membrane protein